MATIASSQTESNDYVRDKSMECGPMEEEQRGTIKFQSVRNDGLRESLILLTSIKIIFQKQLPKMPKEYISRLVYDRNHESIMIVKGGGIEGSVVGGITMRVFKEVHLAEIVFCAITSTEQVKGYGSFLMNYLKHYVTTTYGVTYFLTYADNYAVGYFKKQGFSKRVTLDRSIWAGKIKDYDGGTLMEVVKWVNYRDVPRMLSQQKAALYQRIESLSKSHIVHNGLNFDGKTKINIEDIPGVLEAGWTEDMSRDRIDPGKSVIYEILRPILTELQNHASSWPFREPVNTAEVTDYLSVIKEPMDLRTMDGKLEKDSYKEIDEFINDFDLIIKNCRAYNSENTPYCKCSKNLDTFFKQKMKEKGLLK